ncbi:hypothetical protein U1Q18_009922 [Sarracenia purpurea var. burkii]
MWFCAGEDVYAENVQPDRQDITSNNWKDSQGVQGVQGERRVTCVGHWDIIFERSKPGQVHLLAAYVMAM